MSDTEVSLNFPFGIAHERDQGDPYTQEYIDRGMPGWPSADNVIDGEAESVPQKEETEPSPYPRAKRLS
jgi:hypothetical protein